MFKGEEEIILDNDKGKDSRLLGWIGDSEGQTWKVCYVNIFFHSYSGYIRTNELNCCGFYMLLGPKTCRLIHLMKPKDIIRL